MMSGGQKDFQNVSSHNVGLPVRPFLESISDVKSLLAVLDDSYRSCWILTSPNYVMYSNYFEGGKIIVQMMYGI